MVATEKLAEVQTLPQITSPRARAFDLLAVSAFILLFLLQLSHHEMWRDELNAWAIAVSSPTLTSLFSKLHYEAHPGLWYLLLWLLSRVTPDPSAMKALEAAIGIGTYALIGLLAPFSRLEKILIFLSYFVSFEYTVLSRTYSLCFLLFLVYQYRRCKYPDDTVSNAALLGAMANCDMIGIILSAALFMEYIWNRVVELREHTRLYFAGLTYCALVAFAIWTLIPAPDISWRTTGHILGDRWSTACFFSAAVNYLAVPWFPISSGFPHHFWNPHAQEHMGLYLIALPLVVAGLFLLFRRAPRLLALVTVAAAGAIVFGALFYLGAVRHFGILFMAFLAALWIQQASGVRASVLKYAFLGVSAVAGFQAGIAQWDHPFSNAGVTARWLRFHHLENARLVGTPDTSVAAVAEQLNRPAYFLDCNCSDTFLLFANRRDDFNPAQIPDRLAQAARLIPPREMVLILTHPLTSADLAALAQRSLVPFPIASFTHSEVVDENFFLYRFAPGSVP